MIWTYLFFATCLLPLWLCGNWREFALMLVAVTALNAKVSYDWSARSAFVVGLPLAALALSYRRKAGRSEFRFLTAGRWFLTAIGIWVVVTVAGTVLVVCLVAFPATLTAFSGPDKILTVNKLVAGEIIGFVLAHWGTVAPFGVAVLLISQARTALAEPWVPYAPMLKLPAEAALPRWLVATSGFFLLLAGTILTSYALAHWFG